MRVGESRGGERGLQGIRGRIGCPITRGIHAPEFGVVTPPAPALMGRILVSMRPPARH